MAESEDIPWNREPREIIQEGYHRIYLRHAFNSFFKFRTLSLLAEYVFGKKCP